MTQLLRLGSAHPLLSVCIPTLNGPAASLAACTAVTQHTQHVAHEIVITDCEGELRGYTVPQNEAMAAARGEVLLAMNDDVVVGPGWIDPLLEALLGAGAWCATPDQTHTDGPQVFAPYVMTWQRHAWEQLGGLDERFRWWASDIDLARRLWDLGQLPARVKLEPGITHVCGQTATGEHQAQLNEWALQDLDRYREKWGCSAEEDKVRLAVICGANQDPRLAHLRC